MAPSILTSGLEPEAITIFLAFFLSFQVQMFSDTILQNYERYQYPFFYILFQFLVAFHPQKIVLRHYIFPLISVWYLYRFFKSFSKILNFQVDL